MDPASDRRALGVHIELALPEDSVAIAALHVAVWRSAYAGILPDRLLLRLSVPRLANQYFASIERGRALVARAEEGSEVAGFATFSPGVDPLPGETRRTGEIETLYVGDDWREQGIGRALLEAAAGALRGLGCQAMFLHVLADNPSLWFYRHLGGRAQERSVTYVGGAALDQVAMVWDDLEVLAEGR